MKQKSGRDSQTKVMISVVGYSGQEVPHPWQDDWKTARGCFHLTFLVEVQDDCNLWDTAGKDFIVMWHSYITIFHYLFRLYFGTQFAYKLQTIGYWLISLLDSELLAFMKKNHPCFQEAFPPSLTWKCILKHRQPTLKPARSLSKKYYRTSWHLVHQLVKHNKVMTQM